MEEAEGGSQQRAGTLPDGDGHVLPGLRTRAIVALSEAPTVTPSSLLQTLVSVRTPLEGKYQEVDVGRVLQENVKHTESLNTISRALNILEKYGRNLLSPQKPKFWRAVKFNNPVFKSTVDGIQGGRCILRLYGYTVEQADGMCFPDDVQEPDHGKVAAVTLEVAMFQMELDKLQKGTHPHPELFSRFLPADMGPPLSLTGQQEEILEPCLPASNLTPEEHSQSADVTAPLDKSCTVCSKDNPSIRCHTCQWLLCRDCDALYHRHPSRGGHHRSPLQPGQLQSPPSAGSSSGTTGSWSWSPPPGPLAQEGRPGLGPRSRSADQPGLRQACAGPERRLSELASPPPPPRAPWACASCGLVNEARAVLCGACERPRASPAPPPGGGGGEARPPGPPLLREGWSCQACTFRNDPSAVLCSACDRPRLAGRPSFTSASPTDSILQLAGKPTGAMDNQGSSWECPHCTFLNHHLGRICEVCDRTRSRTATEPGVRGVGPSPQGEEQRPGAPGKGCGPVPGGGPCERVRQEEMRAAGLRLVHLIRKGEEQGWSPEEAFCALQCCRGGDPLSWLGTDLPLVLSSVAELASREGQAAPEDEVGPVTQGEARQAWLESGGDFEEAVRECVRTRACKLREIREMGFRRRDEVLQALYMNGGDVDKAIVDLQRQLLEPFHAQVWETAETAIQLDQPDRQRVLRQILATYNLPSWGRAEIVLSLMQEGRDHYQIQDVVEAVRESQDKEFIKRMLSLTCLVCLSLFPRSKMQSVTSCECTICRDCFKDYFTFTIREKNIRNLVCPGCSKPDIDDEGQLLGYFSTLDVQLRDCLDSEVYNLFHKKLIERTLMKDPKFKWCTHCSNGFIYDGNQMKVTCPQCKGSFCVECKRPWESQHQGISCEDFQNWKRENDPEYQAQGLAAYLKENGIDCPNCKFRYSLAKGGCMHFTCSQCQYEFCSGCYNTFLSKKKCVDPICVLKDTLHAHHPRDCLFYLRDWPVERLQTLLQNNNVVFDREPPVGAEPAPGGLCRVKEQKEVGHNLTDAPCGAVAQQGHAGLCESHYKEYLVSRINGHSLDPAQLFESEEIHRQLARSGKPQPERLAGEEEAHYRSRLMQIISGIPLGDKIPRVRK